MHSEMEKTAAALRLLTKDDRDASRKDLADRKINNTKTSISFGHEKITYISDAMQNQKLILNASNDDNAEQKIRVKQMKTNLTKTNFKMGDDRDTTEYMSTNQMGMLQVIQHPQDARERVEKKALNEAMKEAVKRSSLDFGHENIVYESVMSGQMRRDTGGPGVDFQKRKQEISEMTNALRKVPPSTRVTDITSLLSTSFQLHKHLFSASNSNLPFYTTLDDASITSLTRPFPSDCIPPFLTIHTTTSSILLLMPLPIPSFHTAQFPNWSGLQQRIQRGAVRDRL